MAMTSTAMVFVPRPSLPASRRRAICPASNRSNTSADASTSTEQLRSQLDQLHVEAESARAKANSARLRLMRLSEAAEKLKRQAAISVHTGNEDDARELLFQKKKVMQAMERSKSRIELVDELSAKLNEAISVKETQLIGNVALDLEVDREDSSSPVRIISPKQDVTNGTDEDDDLGPDELKLPDNQNLQFRGDRQESQPADKELWDLQGHVDSGIGNEDSSVSSLMGKSSYKEFLEHVDQQLNKIEAELVTILNVSTLLLNNEEKPKNLKLQQTVEILESVRDIRQRIKRIMQVKVEIR